MERRGRAITIPPEIRKELGLESARHPLRPLREMLYNWKNSMVSPLGVLTKESLTSRGFTGSGRLKSRGERSSTAPAASARA